MAIGQITRIGWAILTLPWMWGSFPFPTFAAMDESDPVYGGFTEFADRQLDRFKEWYHKFQVSGTMRLEAATFFGGTGPEEFVGVTVTPAGEIVAVGNSWGPPFPEPAKPVVLGPDQLWDVPLYKPGAETDKDGRPQKPPDENPNRTGFLVFYSPDLRQVTKIVRLGWGLASISASRAMKDRSLVIAGVATRNFRELAKTAKVFGTSPRQEGKGFGVVEYEGTVNPGDVYVAKLGPDLQSLEWVHILEGHLAPPQKLCEGKDGSVCFMCHGFCAVSGDGRSIQRLGDIYGYFRDVSPRDGTILLGGDWMSGTGREPWKMPWLRFVSPAGTNLAEVYRWPGPLVGHDDFRLVSDSSVRVATYLPNGHVVAVAWSDGGNTVMSRNPVDLDKSAGGGLGMSCWGAGVGSFCHIARFDPANYDDCTYTFWAGYMQTSPGSIRVHKAAGMYDGSVVVLGEAGPFLVQTTLEWFRTTHQYKYETPEGKKSQLYISRANGWPGYTGGGGEGGFAAVFAADCQRVLWCSAIAMCRHNDLTPVPGGMAIVSTCLGPSARDGRDPRFTLDDHKGSDIALWPAFLSGLRDAAKAAAPSPGKRVWDRLEQDLRRRIEEYLDSGAGRDPSGELQTAIADGLNAILTERRDLYDAQAWKNIALDPFEQKLLRRWETATLPDAELPDLNRRLLERAFPNHVFRCPKSNRPAIRNPVQEEYGGGYSDGHIYLLKSVRERTD